MIVVDMQICILKSSSAPPTLLRFLTLIFPSPPHLLLQSGHHHHHHSDQLLLRSCHQYCHRPHITQVMIIFVGVINVFFDGLSKSSPFFFAQRLLPFLTTAIIIIDIIIILKNHKHPNYHPNVPLSCSALLHQRQSGEDPYSHHHHHHHDHHHHHCHHLHHHH